MLVISQRGMGRALGYSPQSAGRLPRLIASKNIASYIGPELREKLQNPLIFQGPSAVQGTPTIDKIHGFDVTLLIDICKAIVAADQERESGSVLISVRLTTGAGYARPANLKRGEA